MSGALTKRLDIQTRRLAAYAEKHGMVLTDYSDLGFCNGAGSRGWTVAALHTDEESEPVVILVKSPTWPNYQARPIGSQFPGGMHTVDYLKKWIRTNARSA